MVVGAGVGFEEEEDEDEGNGNFQKPEELVGSSLTTSLLLSEAFREPFEGERLSQVVARLFGAGFSPSVFSERDLSVVGLLSPTVALRMGIGFFFSVDFVSVDFILAGSSVTSSSGFSRPIIHHEPVDFVWTLTDSVFLSSMSPIRRS